MALGTSFEGAFYDPEERDYAIELLRSDGDIAFRRRYLAFLTAKDDPRADALRLHLLLTVPPDDEPVPPASELRRALRALLPGLDPEWWQLVAKPGEIYSCGSADKDAPPQVRFRFHCPNSWETLEPTTHDRRRFCATCHEHVHWADDLVRVAELARQGACISVPAALADQRRSDLAGSLTGRPDWRGMWAAQLFGPEPDDD